MAILILSCVLSFVLGLVGGLVVFVWAEQR